MILVVDDEVGIRELLSEILIDEGHEVRLAENATAARRVRPKCVPIWSCSTSGCPILTAYRCSRSGAAGQLKMPVVMMSGHGTIDSAVEATRIGATDFLEKPIALQKLLLTVKKALKHESWSGAAADA